MANNEIAVSPEVCYATGRRKRSSARVFLKPGTGRILINQKTPEEYFRLKIALIKIKTPLILTGMQETVDLYITVKGGGISGQAGAVSHGIARALLGFNGLLKQILKKAKLLTRDDREVERKKYGLRKARKNKQYSKR